MRSLYALLANNRGQTLQDYALGIGLFLLTVFFVIGLIVPSVLAPFQSDAGSDNEAQADRIANRIVENTSVPGRMNLLNVSHVESIVDMDLDGTDGLRQRYRLPTTASMNVSIHTMNGSEVVTSGGGVVLGTDRNPQGSISATSARIVTLSDASCPTACRLVVRVW